MRERLAIEAMRRWGITAIRDEDGRWWPDFTGVLDEGHAEAGEAAHQPEGGYADPAAALLAAAALLEREFGGSKE